MTPGVLQRTSFLRGALAAVVVVDLLSFFFFVGDARAIALANGVTLSTLSDVLSRTTLRGAVVVIGVAGAIVFSRRPGRLWAGLMPLGTLMLLSTVHAQLFGSPWRHLYYSGLCLSGWLLGLAVSRRHGQPTDESYARVGSTALLGAAYLNAGISKLVYGGWEWVLGLPIQAAVVAQDGLVADSVVSAYRSWVVAAPKVAALFSVATIVVELAGPLMISNGKARRWTALGLLGMHLNIAVLTHIWYWESMVFLVLFGLLPREPLSQPVVESSHAIFLRVRTFAAVAASLAVWALVGISHQGRRFAQSELIRTAPNEQVAVAPEPARVVQQEPLRPLGEHPKESDEPPVPTEASLRQVGPFVVGQTVMPGWLVDSLEVTGEGFVAVLSGKPGHAKFEVTCAASQYRSPFDLGGAHIFYANNLAFRELEAAGWAFRAELKNAAAGDDICGRLQDWRTSAGHEPTG
jgi:uncharacterized membrane protein YphA (DoxX/SURF4 family)